MGLGAFFKRFFDQKESIPEVDFENIDAWVANQEKELSVRERDALALIKDRVAASLKELEENVQALEEVDLSESNVEKRIKVSVQKNADNYARQVRILIKNLGALREESLDEEVENINNIFSEFHKRSRIASQKATYLIGKEIGDIQKVIGSLAQYLKKTVDEQLIVRLRMLAYVKEKLREIQNTDAFIKDLTQEISVLRKKIKSDKIAEQKKIAAIKNSKEYQDSLRQQESRRSNEKALAQELHALKSKIDFKSLGNEFHTSKKMAVVNEHKQNFTEAFGDGTHIRELLSEAKQDAHDEQIRRINALKKKLMQRVEIVTIPSPTNFDEKLDNKQKKLQKFKSNKQALEDEMRQELSKL